MFLYDTDIVQNQIRKRNKQQKKSDVSIWSVHLSMQHGMGMGMGWESQAHNSVSFRSNFRYCNLPESSELV